MHRQSSLNPFLILGSGHKTRAYTVGGTVSGLSGTVVLLNNAGDAGTVTSNGSFAFATPVTEGIPYNVTVQIQPEGYTCVVTNGSGTMGGSNVTNVSVSCSANLVSITVAPSNPRLPKNISEQFAAIGHYADSSTADITSSVAWDTSNHSVATISGNGLITGVGAGTAQISASLGGVIGTTNLSVTNAVLVSIVISPSNPAVPRGSTLQLSGLGTFSDGSNVDITNQATWSSSVTDVATVNDTDHKGLVIGVAGGSTSILASLNSITGTVTLFAGS